MNLKDYQANKRRIKTYIAKAPMAWIIEDIFRRIGEIWQTKSPSAKLIKNI